MRTRRLSRLDLCEVAWRLLGPALGEAEPGCTIVNGGALRPTKRTSCLRRPRVSDLSVLRQIDENTLTDPPGQQLQRV